MQRKLTAILSADVVGYSRLMEADETGTLERLKTNRSRIFDPRVAASGGRLFKLMGDGALVEFPSVIAAVECALAIQQETAKAELNLTEPKRIRYRIGINLGEVIVEGDDIYGEGVNVAARIQALSPVGGVALSRIVRDQVDGKAAVLFEDMGEHTVKNIERPVHVFSVRSAAASEGSGDAILEEARKHSVCVLPFVNMSGDVEQEYFSDGISEDIITDLSKVSALFVIARNTAFTFKGKSIDIPQVARQLKVSHVLEGSVRKAGGRVRITAQLIDGATGGHAWAERYDRDLNDIFALQDEISEAIVKALKLKLLPEEKKAIERRGTENAEAYNLFLMARQIYANGMEGDPRRNSAVVRLCGSAIEIDPNYAQAWALMALGQFQVRSGSGGGGDGGLATTNRALALDPNLAEAHAVKARIFTDDGNHEEATREMEIALRLNAESYEVNKSAAFYNFTRKRIDAAIGYYEKAASLMETDFSSPGVLLTCYTAKGDRVAARRTAEMVLIRVEKVLAQDNNNGAAIGHGSIALSVLGQGERAAEWMKRALLVDPDNLDMRYNFACTFAQYLNDRKAALDILEPVFAKVGPGFIEYAKVDPDMDPLRGEPRFKAMIEAADARLAKEAGQAG